jgi:APA family basic amino acid/polyamine antiporter
MASADVPAGAGAAAAERTMFVRKATGLVKGWSVLDAFIYSAFAINLMALGFGYAFTTTAFLPTGALIAAIVLSGLFIIFEVLVYASLVAVMPRAGGDYIWQSRVLGGHVGFVLAATGWWFILWHWVPIYANILAVEVLNPIMVIFGNTGTGAFESDWWAYSATNGNGIFVTSLITAGIATVVVAAGMRNYARFQKWCFAGGMLGLLIMLGVFLFHSHSDFVSAFNRSATDLYGAGPNAYEGLQQAHQKLGSHFADFASLPLKATFLLIPFIVFYNLWPNWGATLYGEVRGASDFRKNVYAMGGALIFTTVVVVLTFAVMAHAMGFKFYGILSESYWGYLANTPLAIFPYPGTLAMFFFQNELVQLIIILLLSLWFFGWAGSVFLSSTRMIFAAAFDRILPEWAARVDSRTHVPIAALALMVLPSIPISALYAYSTQFYKYTLDATLVIAITFFGTTLSAIILPWRRPEIYNASPIARYRIFGIPLITASGVAFLVFLGFCLYEWFRDDLYAVNNSTSLRYMGVLYLVAIAIYVVSRVMRKREGIDLAKVNAQIPVE